MLHSLFIIGSQMSLFFLCISFQNMMTKKTIRINYIFSSLRISMVTDNLLRRLVNKLLVLPLNALIVAQLCKHICHLLFIIHQYAEDEYERTVRHANTQTPVYYPSFCFALLSIVLLQSDNISYV